MFLLLYDHRRSSRDVDNALIKLSETNRKIKSASVDADLILIKNFLINVFNGYGKVSRNIELIPRYSVRRGINSENVSFFRDGVNKFKLRRPESESEFRRRLALSVLVVAEKGVPQRCHLHSYLMRSSRVELYPK